MIVFTALLLLVWLPALIISVHKALKKSKKQNTDES